MHVTVEVTTSSFDIIACPYVCRRGSENAIIHILRSSESPEHLILSLRFPFYHSEICMMRISFLFHLIFSSFDYIEIKAAIYRV